MPTRICWLPHEGDNVDEDQCGSKWVDAPVQDLLYIEGYPSYAEWKCFRCEW